MWPSFVCRDWISRHPVGMRSGSTRGCGCFIWGTELCQESGIVTRLRARRPGFDSWRAEKWCFLSSSPRPDRLLGLIHSPIKLVPGVKRPERESGHIPPSVAEVEDTWGHTSTHPYVFLAWCLVKHRDNFTFCSVSHAVEQGGRKWTCYCYFRVGSKPPE
jgi:hypothetical protein